jgi:putative Holliday junction resolvase
VSEADRVLGFDVGARKIGAAVGSRLLGSARALEVLPARGGKPDWSAVERLLQAWSPALVLVGFPHADDGGEQSAAPLARHFAEELQRRFAVPTLLVDERLSSNEARRRFGELRRHGLARRRGARHLDAIAARVIVEQWLANP